MSEVDSDFIDVAGAVARAAAPTGSHPGTELAPPDVFSPSFDFRSPDVHITGMNGALRRWPHFAAQPVSMIDRAGFVPRWTPVWPKIKTVGLTFPAGMEFLPPKPEADDSEQLKEIAPPKPASGT
ncbi:MAG: hypothetical protein KDA58_04825, partial [Planctomycetaceae bacterium]|nr:hypothetical protein [Planctomycetaceae bacterium]